MLYFLTKYPFVVIKKISMKNDFGLKTNLTLKITSLGTI